MLSFFIPAFTLYTLHLTLYTLRSTPYALRFTLYTFYSSLITHSLYLKLRFHSLVPCLSPSYKRPTMNLRRTKEHRKNSQTEKMRFVKIAVSFFFLIPCLTLPRDDRENSERRATELPCPQNSTFLKIAWS